MKAYHVTEADRVTDLLARGMRAGSCWATLDKLVAYYAEDYSDAAVLEIETDRLCPDAYRFCVDHPSIEEPITGAIGMSEAAVHAAWARVPQPGTWRDCVALVGSFQIHAAIPAAALTLASRFRQEAQHSRPTRRGVESGA